MSEKLKAIAHKCFAILVLFLFAYVVYLEAVKPNFVGGPNAGFAHSGLTMTEAGEMFVELGGDPAGKPIIMFVTSWCPYCQQLQKGLNERSIRYVTADIEKNNAALRYYQAVTMGQNSGIPVTVVGTEVIPGYQLEKVVAAFLKL